MSLEQKTSARKELDKRVAKKDISLSPEDLGDTEDHKQALDALDAETDTNENLLLDNFFTWLDNTQLADLSVTLFGKDTSMSAMKSGKENIYNSYVQEVCDRILTDAEKIWIAPENQTLLVKRLQKKLNMASYVHGELTNPNEIKPDGKFGPITSKVAAEYLRALPSVVVEEKEKGNWHTKPQIWSPEYFANLGNPTTPLDLSDPKTKKA